MNRRILTGRCLCGAVTLRAESAATTAHECHCTQCRRQSGHVWAYVSLPRAALRLEGPVGTHAHTEKAVRGFCTICGSFLYWARNGEDRIDISAGLLDRPTGLHLGKPSFAGNRGDYYA